LLCAPSSLSGGGPLLAGRGVGWACFHPTCCLLTLGARGPARRWSSAGTCCLRWKRRAATAAPRASHAPLWIVGSLIWRRTQRPWPKGRAAASRPPHRRQPQWSSKHRCAVGCNGRRVARAGPCLLSEEGRGRGLHQPSRHGRGKGVFVGGAGGTCVDVRQARSWHVIHSERRWCLLALALIRVSPGAPRALLLLRGAAVERAGDTGGTTPAGDPPNFAAGLACSPFSRSIMPSRGLE